MQPADGDELAVQAWRSALCGDLEEAWDILQDRGGLRNVTAVDLMARLLVRQGRFFEARLCWEEILRVAPGYAPAQAALRCLDGPWLFRAVGRKLLSLFAVLVGLVLASIGVLALTMGVTDMPVWDILAAAVLLFVAIFLCGIGVWATCLLATRGLPARSAGTPPRTRDRY